MANITVKNIPDNLYEDLKFIAGKNRRSLNNEIIVCIERAINKSHRIDKDQILNRINRLRSEIKVPFISDQQLNRIKREGRL